jgi:hypothetical protein
MANDHTALRASDASTSSGLGMARKALIGAGLAATSLGIVAITVPTPAFADSTCYTGCTPPPPTGGNGGGTPAKVATAASSSSLPFTGADVEELAAIGGAAILLGGLMVRRSRRRTAAVTADVPGLPLADRTVWSQWHSDSPTQG